MLSIVFYILAAVSVVSALSVVFSKNPVYSVLSLIVTFFTIAGQYVLLNAQFLAAVNIIVYAGAIMVLFLFVIMLLNLNNTDLEARRPFAVTAAAVLASGLLLTTLLGALRSTAGIVAAKPADLSIGLISNLGKTLFNQFAFPFELSSLLFLAAMIGAVMLGKREAE